MLYKFSKTAFHLLIALSISGVLLAQPITKDDYKRAIGFLGNQVINKKILNAYVEPNWFDDNTGLWFVQYKPGKKEYIRVSLPDARMSPLFDHERVAEAITSVTGKDASATDLPIERIRYISKDELSVTIAGSEYTLKLSDYSLIPREKEDRNDLESESPDEKLVAYAENYNLYVRSEKTGEVRQLSKDGAKNYEYASWYGWGDIMEGENGERPRHFGVNWSHDSKWLHANVCDLRTAQKMYLLDWSVDTLYRPRLLSYYRGSPGDTGMVYMEPVFFNAETGKVVRPKLPRTTHINMVSVQWSKQADEVYLIHRGRGFQSISIYRFNLETERLDLLYSETSKTNIDTFDADFREDLGLMFFLSEKSGWRHLYSLNLKTGKQQRITSGEFYVNDIKRIDAKKKRIFLLASGKEKGLNPYFQQLYSVSIEGRGLKLLTPEDRHHVISMSADGDFFVDNFSTVNIPTVTALRTSSAGKVVSELCRASVVGLDKWSAPEVFSTTARDGKTTIYGAIWKPTNFDIGKTYPVIEMSYTGPHTQMFPKDFRGAYSQQSFAELGFVVMVVDGLGSSGRSKEFHDYSYKNLGGNLADHVLAISYLGKKFSWFDTTRVGIYGHSAGGYDAGHALLAYPEYYKVGVASSADHDHRMEKAWWPEMYMGWPVDSAYHQQSNITMAGNLKGKLLITHGGIDENVNPSATFKLAEALIKADKQFDMLILPSQHHGYRGEHLRYFTKVRWNYFVQHLRNVEPIWDFEWE